ncbi:glycosyltransferase family 2 protein [Cryobacterium sp. Hh7]|uniref:glycosyltransferase family 2 protein n=1 Tax=Cryobacterium sp. Hh7 TaxID=1259159 RepID=UPI001068EF0A|nr:glycosyltransferase family 2 protein [Cryobacterium sp. Hh7]TFD51771.1 glycosyltransferase family 2 protein [Cryobacterium sp. Hh7]
MLAPDLPPGTGPEREVPAYTADVFSARTSQYVVLVFVINEGEKIRSQIVQMHGDEAGVDVVVADGGSTDGALALEFLRQNGVTALLTKTGPGKLSAQMRMGLAFAMDEGYDGVIVVDGNGKDDLRALPDFIRLLDEGYDHVQGSRFIPGGRAVNTPLSRLVGVRMLHAPLISLASRRRHTDTTNGFRAYSARLILDPTIAVFRSIFVTYELHYHLAIESSRASRFRTTETPVTRTYPITGKVPTKITPIRGNSHVLAVLFRAVVGRYRH